MAVPQAMEALSERAASIRESLQKSQTITDNMVSILGSFDHRLSALETAMRPTQVTFPLPFLAPRKKWKKINSVQNEKELLKGLEFHILVFFFLYKCLITELMQFYGMVFAFIRLISAFSYFWTQ